MRVRHLVTVLNLFVLPFAHCASEQGFRLMEASIADVHTALRAGKVTCHSLVKQYLDRIDAYDHRGPFINSMLYINPKSIEQADAFDKEDHRTHNLGPLGCIPVVLKDNFDTSD